MSTEQLLQLDRALLVWINSHSHWLLDAILAPVAYAGEMGLLWIAVALGMLIWGRPGMRPAAVMMLVTMLVVDRLICSNIQHCFLRERPYVALESVRQLGFHWTSSSFPSAHAHSVWIAAIVLGSRWRKLLVPLVVFAILTCYSRPYFGMHYPGDVIAGSLIGICAGLIVVLAPRLWRPRPKPVASDEVQK